MAETESNHEDAIDDVGSKWILTQAKLDELSSKKPGFIATKELKHRQYAAFMIQNMGQRLRLKPLCVNTAIVYMHRFYAFHSFIYFPYNDVAIASLFLASKTEEEPRFHEHVVQVAQSYLKQYDKRANRDAKEIASDLKLTENILLQTLGFELVVDHPHTHVIKAFNLIKRLVSGSTAHKDLTCTSYYIATSRFVHFSLQLPFASLVRSILFRFVFLSMFISAYN